MNRDQRAARIRELRRNGLTLDEVGGVFGLSRERIRQILAATGGDPHAGRHVTSARTRADRDATARLFLSVGRSIPPRERTRVQLARRLGWDAETVQRWADRLGVELAPTPQRKVWTRERIAAALAEYAVVLGRSPRTTDCNTGRPAGVPVFPVVFREFGSWDEALVAAGLTPHRDRRSRAVRDAAPR